MENYSVFLCRSVGFVNVAEYVQFGFDLHNFVQQILTSTVILCVVLVLNAEGRAMCDHNICSLRNTAPKFKCFCFAVHEAPIMKFKRIW